MNWIHMGQIYQNLVIVNMLMNLWVHKSPVISDFLSDY